MHNMGRNYSFTHSPAELQWRKTGAAGGIDTHSSRQETWDSSVK